MLAPADIAVVLLLMVGWPLYEYFVDWPRFRRELNLDARRARLKGYRLTLVIQWVVSALAVFVWLRADRSWEEIGLRPVDGWRLWATAGAALLFAILIVVQVARFARSHEDRAKARASRSIQALEKILPHDTREVAWFLLLAVTAGICEEFLFRGYLIAALSVWIGWWPAAAVAVIPFGVLHGYQGWRGVIQTTIVGILMTAVVAVTHSLVPAMILHVLIDIQGGLVTWTVLRERPESPISYSQSSS